MKFRPFFMVISGLLIATSLFSILKWGFKTGIDFAGGTNWEVSFKKTVDQSAIKTIFSNQKIDLKTISQNQNKFLLKFSNISQDQKLSLITDFKKIDPDFSDDRFESLGPSLGKELLSKTIIAIILSSLALLLFIGSRFKDISFGIGAVLAMFHDALILIGAFSIFGHFFGAELDSLFVTALLTTLSASVHDTVVTFDRIRELKTKSSKLDWVVLANQAVSEVIVRSINNSMTIIFMLTALVALGGSTTRWFALALLTGVICGTYSSTAVAIPLVLWLKKFQRFQ
ncbi:MAG TPA: protein translocase subunit SecF [Candidatus Woesebacteria bacterium]|nr:protein translocase subunit SecF [Candidatus Woesebacteria bacterium]